MRKELFYNPGLLCERLAEWSLEHRRLARLRGTVASGLKAGHIDSLELLELLIAEEPRVIYDIGANIGTWTLLAKAIFPQAGIHAFEPLAQHIEKFQRLTKNLSGVKLHPIALGAEAKLSLMKVTDFSDASSLLDLTATGKQQWNLQQVAEIPVQIERLDDWVRTHGLPPPDLIKLDIQGFELEALRGAEQNLHKAKRVLLEASFRDYYQKQCRFDELVSFLAEAGLYVQAFGRGTLLGKELVQADVLFGRPHPKKS